MSFTKPWFSFHLSNYTHPGTPPPVQPPDQIAFVGETLALFD